jgi:hypothetical protein
MSESFKPISHPHLQKTFSIQAAPDDSMLSARNNRTTAVSTSDFVAATAHLAQAVCVQQASSSLLAGGPSFCTTPPD